MANSAAPGYSPQFNGPEGQEDMPWLLTTGPAVTSREVKLAMLADWSVTDPEFVSLALRVSEEVLFLSGAHDAYDCIPVNMSGTAALEIVLSALCPAGRKRTSLIATTGPVAQQCSDILSHLKRNHEQLKLRPGKALDARRMKKALADHPEVQTIVLSHVDAYTGIVNPVEELAQVCHEAGKQVVLDARNGLGATGLDLSAAHVSAAIAVPWATLGGVPGFSMMILRRDLLNAKMGKAAARTLDLFELWNGIHQTGQFPGTPPAQAISACSAALRELDMEGGPQVRLARFRRLHEVMLAGLTRLGFAPAVPPGENWCGYLTLFAKPADPQYSYTEFAQRLRQQGFVIMPGDNKLAPQGFRLSTIGQLNDDVITLFVEAVEKVMRDLGMRSGAPK